MALHSNTCRLMLIGNHVEYVQRFACSTRPHVPKFSLHSPQAWQPASLQKLTTIELCAHFPAPVLERPKRPVEKRTRPIRRLP